MSPASPGHTQPEFFLPGYDMPRLTPESANREIPKVVTIGSGRGLALDMTGTPSWLHTSGVDSALLTSIARDSNSLKRDDYAYVAGDIYVTPVGYVYDDTAPGSVREDGVGAARMSANRNQYVTIRDAAGNERGLNIDASGQLAITAASIPLPADAATETTLDAIKTAVEGTLTVGLPSGASTAALQTTGNAILTTLDAAQDLSNTLLGLIAGAVRTDDVTSHTSGSSTGMAIVCVATPTDTAVDANDFGHLAMSVDRRLLVDADVGNTVTVDGSAVTQPVEGDADHDATDTGAPVKIGFKALDLAESPTAVDKGDRVNGVANRDGVQYVIGGHPNTVRYNVQRTASGTTSAGIAAPGVGSRICITSYLITNDIDSSATSQGKILFTGSTVVCNHQGIAKGSGVQEGDGSGILAIGGDNVGVDFTTDATANVDFHVSYFIMEG